MSQIKIEQLNSELNIHRLRFNHQNVNSAKISLNDLETLKLNIDFLNQYYNQLTKKLSF